MITKPDVPYMIVLGTSHTAGQCNDGEDINTEIFFDTTFAEYIANDLGLELVRIGLPGCTNIELLFSFNKLVDSGFITDENMKFFILESRLMEGSTRIPIESIFTKDANEIIECNLERERYDTSTPEKSFKEAYNMFSLYFSSHRADDIDKEYKAILNDVNDPIDGNYKLPSETKYVLKDFTNFLIHYGNSYQQFMDNMIIINSILNQLEFLNKKYCWLTFNVLDNQKKLISNRCFGPRLLETLLIDNINNILYRLKYKNIQCKCEHLNEYGNRVLYDIIISRLRKRFYDKTT